MGRIKSIAFEVGGWLVIAFVTFLVGYAVVGCLAIVIDSMTSVVVLMPCDTEDSDNCYWDAEQQGNGVGKSFVVLDGKVYYE